jgi:heme/copper-type cytochrome/quinol oxidase subunit 2
MRQLSTQINNNKINTSLMVVVVVVVVVVVLFIGRFRCARADHPPVPHREHWRDLPEVESIQHSH